MTNRLVLLRHGQSEWNLQDRFTGWQDVRLSKNGVAESQAAGCKLKKAGWQFDCGFTSRLSRSIETLWRVLSEIDQMYLPLEAAWQLNERHYGGLTGLNKKETVARVGAEQVKIWRRSYDVRPPKCSAKLFKQIADDPRYADLKKKEIPWGESLEDTCHRVIPYYIAKIEPRLLAGQNIIIAAHGNSLRGLIKYLEQISDAEIVQVEVPTGQPLVYEFSKTKAGLKVKKKYYL